MRTTLANTIIIIASISIVSPLYSLRSLIIPRSQGVRLSREFNARYRDQENTEAAGSLTLTFERLRSIRSKNSAECLFGSETLYFSGSAVPQRKSTDLLADYFGLAPDFQGSATFHPQINNLVVDAQYSLHLDCLKPGLFITIDVPLARSRWTLGTCITNGPTTALFPPCYMNTGTTPAVAVGTLQQALTGQVTFGAMQRVWNFGKFAFCTLQHIRITNIGLTVTYPLIYHTDVRMNVLLNACIPAGNKPDPQFVFNPIAGNGHFGTIGIGFNLTWHALATRTGTLSFYSEGRMSHLFKHNNIRSFDFRNNGPLSRYMLLQQFAYDNDALFYTGEIINAINFATRRASVYVPLEGEVLAAFVFDNDHWNANVGYTLYGRTREQLSLRCCNTFPCDITHKLFGIKGTENLCTLTSSTLQLINTTQSNATIFAGGTADPKPVILSCCDLDPDSATVPEQLTHTFFAQATYLWPRCTLSPYFGIGFETEIAPSSSRCSISQWGVWVTGGISF